MSTIRTTSAAQDSSNSTVERRDGLIILHLYGTPYERGFAHGALLRNEIVSSRIAEYYSNLLRKLYKSSTFAKSVPGYVRRLIGDLLEWWFYAPLERLCLEETREELYGVADAAGLDRRSALRAMMAPDVMEHLAPSFLRGGKEALGNYYLGGCSGFYVRGTATRPRSHALFARNMDFPGVFVWKHPTVIFSHPTEEVDVLSRNGDGFTTERRRKSPYVYVSSAGVPGHGLTGMSGDGLAVGSFVCISNSYGRHGMLMLDFSHYLMTRADSVAAAVELARRESLVSAAPHATLLADAEQAASLEVDAEQSIARELSAGDDVLTQTNHFILPQLKKREIEYPLEREHTIGRFRFIKDAVLANYGKIDVARAVDIVTGCTDRLSGKPRAIGDFPSQPITMTSVVFEPATRTMWVANGKPPAVCNSDYIGIDVGRELSGERYRLPTHSRSVQPVIPGFEQPKVNEDMRRSIRHLMLSQELLNRGRTRRALSELEEAIALHDEPGYRYLRALVNMLADELEASLEEIQALQRSAQFPPVKSSALILWEARVLDLLGKRTEAKVAYRRLLAIPGLVPNLHAVGERGLRRAYRRAQRPGTIDYSFLGPTTL